MQDRNRRIGSNQDQLKVTISNVDRESPGEAQPEVDEEQLRTLWVGSLHCDVDEEILYELFQNAGPLESIKIPKDRETKKQRNFGFVVFQHECSVKYAYDLLNNTQLFGNKIRLQNKTTGLGMVSNNFRNHSRSNTMPNLHMSNGGRRDDWRDRGREDSGGFGMEQQFGRHEDSRSPMMRQNSFGGGRGFGMNYQQQYGHGAPQMGQDGGHRRQEREREYEREQFRDRSFERRGRDFERRDDRRRQY